MTSENTTQREQQNPGITSYNTTAALAEYRAVLVTAPLSAETVRTYTSKVRSYLAWLTDTDVRGDPLNDRRARDWAVRDYRTHLLTVAKRAPRRVRDRSVRLRDP